MQNLLTKMGFTYCGTVFVTEDNSPRLAYEKAEGRIDGEKHMSGREKQFEKMLTDIQKNYGYIVEKMDKLKKEDKTKSATYRQLMGSKLNYQNMLSLYKIYGLLEE